MSSKIHQKAIVIDDDGSERSLTVTGRYAQTLKALVAAGQSGTTALEISSWALRLSHYVFILRREYGLEISMELEPNGGDYGGSHGRYRLVSRVLLIDEQEAA